MMKERKNMPWSWQKVRYDFYSKRQEEEEEDEDEENLFFSEEDDNFVCTFRDVKVQVIYV